VLRPSATVELLWQDETGSTASMTLSIPSSLTYDEIAADAEALAALVVPLTGAALTGIRVRYRSALGTLIPADDSTPITRVGAFYFDTQPDEPDTIITVPAIKDSIILVDEPMAGVGIDRQNPDVEAFVTAVIGSNLSNPFGDVITALIAAYRVSRV